MEQAGQGSPVVLVHEGIADSRMWEPQWAAYAERYRVVRFDMRGFGQSPPAVGTFSLAGDLVELLEGLELGPATLIGVSLGGAVAMETAIARPDLVSRLVLVAPGLRGFEMTDETKAGWAEEEAALERGDVDAAVEVNLRMWVDGPSRSLRTRSIPTCARRSARCSGARSRSGSRRARRATISRSSRVGEIGSARSRSPRSSSSGTSTGPRCSRSPKRLETEIPNARRETIAGTAHVPSMERPDEFDRLVLEFLS